MSLNGVLVKDIIVELVSKIGENIKLRRFKKVLKENSKSFYIHNKANNIAGKIISAIKFKSNSNQSSKLATNICMHIAAMSPMALDEKSLDKNFINKERK